MESSRKISVLATGGTINGRRINNKLDVPRSMHLDEQWVRSLDANITIGTSRAISCLMSENMQPSDWIEIAKEIVEEIKHGASGIVVTHGTYTLPYTASALSFMLRKLSVPIVLTGSQLPRTEKNSDAATNVRAAMTLASNKNIPPGVYVVFVGCDESASSYFGDPGNKVIQHIPTEPVYIYRGTRVRKAHTWRYDCYQSVNEEPIGKILNGHIQFNSNFNQDSKSITNSETYADTDLNPNVMLLKAFPGLRGEYLDWLVDGKRCKGIVIESYADGTLSTREGSEFSFIEHISRATSKGIPIFFTSQSIGRIRGEYKAAEELSKAGAISLADMTTEAAIPKLMWVLGHASRLQKIKKMMLENIAGEIFLRA